MVQKNSKLSVRRQCQLLNINRSSLYYEPITPSEEEHDREEVIMAIIDEIHNDMPYIGSRRLVPMIKERGYNVGRKLVRRLMCTMGLRVIFPKPNLSKRNFKQQIVPYLLRNYNVIFPNQVWSIDITYIKLHKSHMYLTAIIDWYSRKIVGWNLSDTLDTDGVIAAVKDAVAIHGIPAILNSDQGSQFTSDEYKSLLKELGIRQSMDGKSRWADNIMIERWFRSLKTELIYINEFQTPRELRVGITEYIDTYNNKRPHEALGYSVPSKIYSSCFQVLKKNISQPSSCEIVA